MKAAIPFDFTGTVISATVQKENDLLPKEDPVEATIPFFSVNCLGLTPDIVVVSTVKLIFVVIRCDIRVIR